MAQGGLEGGLRAEQYVVDTGLRAPHAVARQQRFHAFMVGFLDVPGLRRNRRTLRAFQVDETGVGTAMSEEAWRFGEQQTFKSVDP